MIYNADIMSYDTIQSEIVNTLNDAMDISSLKIINESHMHNVPKESETHFKACLLYTSDAADE